MSRFVPMFTKLAADAHSDYDSSKRSSNNGKEGCSNNRPLPPSLSSISFSSRVLSHELRRRFSSPSPPSRLPSIDHSDALRRALLRSQIVLKAHQVMEADRLSAPFPLWNLPPPPTFSSSTISDEAQSIAANNAALDALFSDFFSSPPSLSSNYHHSSQSNVVMYEDEEMGSKRSKIRKIEGGFEKEIEEKEEMRAYSLFDAESLLPIHLRS